MTARLDIVDMGKLLMRSGQDNPSSGLPIWRGTCGGARSDFSGELVKSRYDGNALAINKGIAVDEHAETCEGPSGES